MSFDSLNLNSELLRAIEACGFTEPSEIQRQAIPVALAGRDLMASAQTGTGKTAAFVLPVLQRLATPARSRGHGPRVLVLTPTRELAGQVEANIRELGRFSRIVSGSVVGGVPYPPQMRLLGKPLDLLVATPGRLMDHMERGRVDFSRLEVLILDEADRMLDMGFVDAVNQIAAATPASRQTLLFSATLEGRILEIARRLLKDPARIALAANTERHASIEQQAHQADDIGHKHKLLTHLLSDQSLSQAVIFTATKRGADKLATKLQDQGHQSAALHGDMNQGKRKRTVDQMRRGKVRVLVATDVAARGLDIRGISHVINFDLPMVAEDYIHRIGRTGRGGATGTAISLIGPDDRRNLAGIERLLGERLPRIVVPGLEPQKPAPRGDDRRPAGKRKFKGGGRDHRAGKPGAGRSGNGGRPSIRHKGRASTASPR
ncbi:ATP-dependent RNA helicase RhlE [Thiohalobacter sp. COW1]|uniref:DEAD/DEAH box helicase n=1 Tax=Thiohalobacter sp. COW1 TaxID=2795687 RepID=UPI0019161B32|nr:DEAD/DEAH box helicase [Thiohalobacter sp. COW1]BCO31880.1 ATP-dependent RNA helicase RhlE [Thiohalobacter sp. COW1]